MRTRILGTGLLAGLATTAFTGSVALAGPVTDIRVRHDPHATPPNPIVFAVLTGVSSA